MTIQPKAVFSAIPIKLLMVFFTELEEIISQFVWKHRRSQIAKTNLERKRGGGINFPDFRVYYKAMVIKTVWHKKGNIDQWIKIESPEVHPHIYANLIFDKRGKNIQWKKRHPLQ